MRNWEVDWPTVLAALGMVAVLSFVQIAAPALIEQVQQKVFDQLQRWSPRETPESSPVVIVDLDEESLRDVGQWPWPRSTVADLVDRLREAGAAVIGFDIIFAEPDRLSPPRYASVLDERDPGAAALLRSLPDYDTLFAAAVARAKVVVAEAGSTRPVEQHRGPPPEHFKVVEIGGDPRGFLPRYPDTVRSLEALERAAAGSGLVTVTPAGDGIVRQLPLLVQSKDRIIPSLSLELLRVATGEPNLVIRSDPSGVKDVLLQGVPIPTDRAGHVLIRFTERRADLYVSAGAVLRGEVDPARIAGKIVLIGTSAAGLGDIKATPVAGNMPGVEAHAQAIETILAGDHLTRPLLVVGAERLGLIVAGVLLAIVGPSLPAIVLPPALLVLTAGWFGASWVAFQRWGVLLDGVYPAVAMATIVLWLALARYVREQTGRQQVRKAFGLYLSPVMVEQLSRNRGLVQLGGERRTMTVLFSDVRDFTSISEGYVDDPEALTRLLNRYLTEMTSAILHRGGTVDKYIGDAIMAFWNAPLATDDHAVEACLAALDMQERLARLNHELGREQAQVGLAFRPIRIGIGINTGACFVGNLGSSQRFSYSVMGDTVNVAARLETETKTYRVPVLVGEPTRALAPQFAFLSLDTTLLKGKSQSVAVHALLGDAAVARSEAFTTLKALHEPLVEAIARCDVERAEQLVRACQAQQQTFGLEDFYRQCWARIDVMRGAPSAAVAQGLAPAR